MAVWIIADDFTGANDSIVRFATAGARAVTICKTPFIKELLTSYQAVAINTNSRGMSHAEAYQTNHQVGQKLPLHSGDVVYKKIDSALRGKIGVEIDGLLDGVGHEKIALVAPAFPENLRITAGGYQLLNGIPVHESEMASDPVTPVKESHLPTLLADTSHYKVGYLPLGIVGSGWQKVPITVKKLIAEGCRIIAADATSNDHLRTLAKLCVCSELNILPCGTSGLAGALAQKLFSPRQVEILPTRSAKSKVIAVIGSRSRISRLQIQRALKELPWVAKIEVQRLTLVSREQRGKEICNVSNSVTQAFADGKKGVIVCFDDNPTVEPGSLVATELAAGLGEITRLLVETTGVKRSYLSGGDIAAAAIHALGGWGLEIQTELETGVCSGSLQGGQFTGLKVVTKAGSFGNEGTLVRLLQIMSEGFSKKAIKTITPPG